MDIKQGEIFEHSTDGVDFVVKKVVRNMVVLETRDGERQILTGIDTLTSTPFYLKKEKGNPFNPPLPFKNLY